MKSLANRMIKLGEEKDEVEQKVYSSSRPNSSNPRIEVMTPSLGEPQSTQVL